MSNAVSVSPMDLLLDLENPRFPSPATSQRDAICQMAKLQKRKLVTLAEDILENGLNPTEMMLVIPVKKGELKQYCVVEGNRRLAVIKALENPDLFSADVDAGIFRDFKKLHLRYLKKPLEFIACSLLADRDASRHWIELRHTGENEGAGIVRWEAGEIGRFRAGGGKTDPVVKILDFLQSYGCLNDEQRKAVPVSNLERMLSSPPIREKVGVQIIKGQVNLTAAPESVAKALMYLIKDLTKKQPVTVGDLYNKEKRSDYAEKIPASVAVRPHDSAPTPLPESSSTYSPPAAPARSKSPASRDLPPSDHFIPKTFNINCITDARVKQIAKELKSLSFSKEHVNAIAVLSRVFLELSIDCYGEREDMKLGDREALGLKMQKVANHLHENGRLKKTQLPPILNAAHKTSYLAVSVVTMHGYVHNQFWFPHVNDLRATWNTFQHFIAAIWGKEA